MQDSKSVAMEVARKLEITAAKLYAYVNSNRKLKEQRTKLLKDINE